MPNKDYTDITVVLDRSGSMSWIAKPTEKGLDEFVKEQQNVGGKCLYTLWQFDHESEMIHNHIPIDEVPPTELVPRGSTALYDTIAKAVHATSKRITKMGKWRRPGLVNIVIVTDGMENASRDYNAQMIKDLISEYEAKGWQFNFLSSDLRATEDAVHRLGFNKAATSVYGTTIAETQNAYKAISSNTKRMRSSTASGQTVKNEYTGAERRAMKRI